MPTVSSIRKKQNSSALKPFDIAVVGTGPVGLLAALILTRMGYNTGLLGPAPNLAVSGQNARTAALFPASINLLQQLDVWHLCAPDCAPLNAIRIVDDMDDTLLKAPEVLFSATEIGEENFGFNVPNDCLVRGLWQTLQHLKSGNEAGQQAQFQFIETPAVTDLDIEGDQATLTAADGGHITTQLVVAADGRKSLCRRAAKLETKTWSYPQTAITCVFDHERRHRGISTELHRQSGPCTTVPMTGNRSSLVWMETHETAKHLMGLSDDAFMTALEQRLHSHLGPVSNVTTRAAFPLSGLSVSTTAGNRVALVGEAAHVVPPIGAQGLNLGFRDIVQLTESLPGPSANNDPGNSQVLARYASARKPDITARIWGIDVVNRSLLAGRGPAHVLRGAGLAAIKIFPSLRRRIINQGLNPFGPAPKLKLTTTQKDTALSR